MATSRHLYMSLRSRVACRQIKELQVRAGACLSLDLKPTTTTFTISPFVALGSASDTVRSCALQAKGISLFVCLSPCCPQQQQRCSPSDLVKTPHSFLGSIRNPNTGWSRPCRWTITLGVTQLSQSNSQSVSCRAKKQNLPHSVAVTQQ